MTQAAFYDGVLAWTNDALELAILEPQGPLVDGKGEVEVLVGFDMAHVFPDDIAAQDGVLDVGIDEALGVVEHEHAVVDVGQGVAQLVQTDGGTEAFSSFVQQGPHFVAKFEEEGLGLACPVAVELHFAIGNVVGPTHIIDTIDDVLGERIKRRGALEGWDGDENDRDDFDITDVLDGIAEYGGGDRHGLLTFAVVKVIDADVKELQVQAFNLVLLEEVFLIGGGIVNSFPMIDGVGGVMHGVCGASSPIVGARHQGEHDAHEGQ